MDWVFVICLVILVGGLLLCFGPTLFRRRTDEDFVPVAHYIEVDSLQRAKTILEHSGIATLVSENRFPYGPTIGPNSIKVARKDLERARVLLSQTADLSSGLN